MDVCHFVLVFFIFNFNFLLETESHYILKLALKGYPPTSAL